MGNDALFLSRCKYAREVMQKLCRAHASERIDTPVFRQQRAAIVDYLIHEREVFPEISYNQYSQSAIEEFAVEETPVVNDLGFTEDTDSLPTLNFELSQQQTSQIHFDSADFTSKQAVNEKYYLLILTLVVSSICVVGLLLLI